MPPFFCVWCMTYYGWLVNITSFPHWTVSWTLACFHVSVSADVSQEKGPSKVCPQMSVPFSLGQWTPFSPLLLCSQTPIVECVCEPLAPVPITSNMKWQLPTLHIIRFPLGEALKTIIVAIFFVLFFWDRHVLCSQVNRKLKILLSLPPVCWDYRHGTPHSAEDEH